MHCIFFYYYYIEFTKKSVGHCNGTGTDKTISLLPAERVLWGHRIYELLS